MYKNVHCGSAMLTPAHFAHKSEFRGKSDFAYHCRPFFLSKAFDSVCVLTLATGKDVRTSNQNISASIFHPLGG